MNIAIVGATGNVGRKIIEVLNNKKYTEKYIQNEEELINFLKISKKQIKKIVFTNGCFDLIHPGYVKMFEDARKHCTHLTVALHENPNTENNKLSPTQTIEEREQILMALANVDDVRTYNSEYALSEYLKVGKFDVRFLGDDYKDKEEYTGKDLDLKVVFLDRSHGYSTTKLKKKISEDFK